MYSSDIVVLPCNVMKDNTERIFGSVNMQERRTTMEKMNIPVWLTSVGMTLTFGCYAK